MSGMNIANFFPWETVKLSATDSSSSKKFIVQGSIADMSDVMVTNSGTSIAYVAFGDSKGGTVTITANVPSGTGQTNATPILPGATVVLNKNKTAGNPGADTCAAICDTGNTTTLYFTSGRGS